MKRILIVDDEVDLCLLLKHFLTKKNYEVHVAHTLADGLEKLKSVKPHTLMLDNNLPDGMGWELANDIKANYPSLNITLLSAFQHVKDFIPANSGYANNIRFLEKPISLGDVEKHFQ